MPSKEPNQEPILIYSKSIQFASIEIVQISFSEELL